MIEWIKCCNKLPQEDQHCWICDKKNNVVDGWFRSRCFDQDSDVYRKGFVIDEETGFYEFLEDILHWMPYFTPEPPND